MSEGRRKKEGDRSHKELGQPGIRLLPGSFGKGPARYFKEVDSGIHKEIKQGHALKRVLVAQTKQAAARRQAYHSQVMGDLCAATCLSCPNNPQTLLELNVPFLE